MPFRWCFFICLFIFFLSFFLSLFLPLFLHFFCFGLVMVSPLAACLKLYNRIQLSITLTIPGVPQTYTQLRITFQYRAHRKKCHRKNNSMQVTCMSQLFYRCTMHYMYISTHTNISYLHQLFFSKSTAHMSEMSACTVLVASLFLVINHVTITYGMLQVLWHVYAKNFDDL